VHFLVALKARRTCSSTVAAPCRMTNASIVTNRSESSLAKELQTRQSRAGADLGQARAEYSIT